MTRPARSRTRSRWNDRARARARPLGRGSRLRVPAAALRPQLRRPRLLAEHLERWLALSTRAVAGADERRPAGRSRQRPVEGGALSRRSRVASVALPAGERPRVPTDVTGYARSPACRVRAARPAARAATRSRAPWACASPDALDAGAALLQLLCRVRHEDRQVEGDRAVPRKRLVGHLERQRPQLVQPRLDDVPVAGSSLISRESTWIPYAMCRDSSRLTSPRPFRRPGSSARASSAVKTRDSPSRRALPRR